MGQQQRQRRTKKVIVCSLQVLLIATVTIWSGFLAVQIRFLQNHVNEFESTVNNYVSIVDSYIHNISNDNNNNDNNKSTSNSNNQPQQSSKETKAQGHASSSSSLVLSNAQVFNVTLSKTIVEAMKKLNWSDQDMEERKPLIRILELAGYKLNRFFQNETKLAALPTWSSIIETYGPPKLIGLEWCDVYQQSYPPNQRIVGVAGAFDSGTNLLHSLLASNCEIKERSNGNGIRWQVPWGKHYPVEYRHNHTTTTAKDIPMDSFFTVTSIRDPMTWMQSMCRQSYSSQFDHDDRTCPNIIPYEEDIRAHPRYGKMKYMPVHTKYEGGLYIKYESLAHMWNQWYRPYLSKDDQFPRLIVRLEDLVFHADTVMPQICTCAGGTYTEIFSHSRVVQNQNRGIDTTNKDEGLYRSVVRYGTIANRKHGYPKFQLEAIYDILDHSMMELFGYPLIDPSKN